MKDAVNTMKEYYFEKEMLNQKKLESLRKEQRKVLLAYSEFRENEKPQFQCRVKDCKVVLYALRRDRSKKILKWKQQIVELSKLRKTRMSLSIQGIGGSSNLKLLNDVVEGADTNNLDGVKNAIVGAQVENGRDAFVAI